MSDKDISNLYSGLTLESPNEDSNSTSTRFQRRLTKKSTTSLPANNIESRPKRQAAMQQHVKAREDKFMENFDPETSAREKRKLDRKINVPKKVSGALFDHQGIHIRTGKDLCDCLEDSCQGCFFPCKKCSSQKCGLDCRCNRKYMYEVIEYHGYGFHVKNNNL